MLYMHNFYLLIKENHCLDIMSYFEMHRKFTKINITNTSVESAQFLIYITTENLGDGSWKGYPDAFIFHWQDQIRKYNSLVKYEDQMSNSIKHTIVENKVNEISYLCDVKTQATQFRAQMDTHLTCEHYFTLVLSDAQAYDAQHATNEKSRCTRHSMYNITMHTYNPMLLMIDIPYIYIYFTVQYK